MKPYCYVVAYTLPTEKFLCFHHVFVMAESEEEAYAKGMGRPDADNAIIISGGKLINNYVFEVPCVAMMPEVKS